MQSRWRSVLAGPVSDPGRRDLALLMPVTSARALEPNGLVARADHSGEKEAFVMPAVRDVAAAIRYLASSRCGATGGARRDRGEGERGIRRQRRPRRRAGSAEASTPSGWPARRARRANGARRSRPSDATARPIGGVLSWHGNRGAGPTRPQGRAGSRVRPAIGHKPGSCAQTPPDLAAFAAIKDSPGVGCTSKLPGNRQVPRFRARFRTPAA